jgi:hypothetical protein
MQYFLDSRIIVRKGGPFFRGQAGRSIREADSFIPWIHLQSWLPHDVLAPWVLKMASPILYPSGANIRLSMKEAGPPLDALVSRGCSMMC